MENRSLIKKVLETDPAARYALNVIINYPGGDRFGDIFAELLESVYLLIMVWG